MCLCAVLFLYHLQQQVKEMHPEFGESADMFFFGTAIDGRLRTSIFAFKLGRFTPTPNPLTKSKMIILKEGPLVISAFKATNKSTLVHAVLVSTGLKWYSDASKRRLIGEVCVTVCVCVCGGSVRVRIRVSVRAFVLSRVLVQPG